MSNLREQIEAALEPHGVVARRDHPQLAEGLSRRVRRGQLHAVLPGVYCDPGRQNDLLTCIRAAMLWHDDLVLTGPAAARVSFWPTVPIESVTLASVKELTAPRGFVVQRRRIDPDLIIRHGRLRYTVPALTALDLCPFVEGDGIDTALRTRTATLAGLREVLSRTRGRRGNVMRQQLLLDSRDEPWSAAERRLHRLLRAAGITGWMANRPVGGSKVQYFLDVSFLRVKLAIEVDGRLHENDLDLFESDRWRQNWLVLHGWRVLRFTWPMLRDHPEYVLATIRAALAEEAPAREAELVALDDHVA